MSQKRLLAVALVVVLAAGSGWAAFAAFDGEEGSGQAASGQGDIPDVVAEVNGEEIPKADFVEAYEARQQAAAAQQQQGQEQPDEAQLRDEVVQSLVNEELFAQEADRREIEATDEQVQQLLSELAQQNGMKSADEFVAALEEQGMDREEVESQAALQSRFDLLVADEAGPLEASGKEVRALYAQLKQQQAGGKGGQQVPPLKRVRPQLEQQVESQQESEAARGLIDQLREDADITVNL